MIKLEIRESFSPYWTSNEISTWNCNKFSIFLIFHISLRRVNWKVNSTWTSSSDEIERRMKAEKHCECDANDTMRKWNEKKMQQQPFLTYATEFTLIRWMFRAFLCSFHSLLDMTMCAAAWRVISTLLPSLHNSCIFPFTTFTWVDPRATELH